MRYHSENLAHLLIAPFQAVLHEVQTHLSAQIDVERLAQQETIAENNAQAVVQSAHTALKLSSRFAQRVTPTTQAKAETSLPNSFSTTQSTQQFIEKEDSAEHNTARAVVSSIHSSDSVALEPFINSRTSISSETTAVPTMDARFVPTLETLTPNTSASKHNTEQANSTRATIAGQTLAVTESLSIADTSNTTIPVASLPFTTASPQTNEKQSVPDSNALLNTAQLRQTIAPTSPLFASESVATSHLTVTENLVPTAKVAFHAVRQTVTALSEETNPQNTPKSPTLTTDAPVINQASPTAVFIPLRTTATPSQTANVNAMDLPSTLRQRFSSAVEPALQQAYQVTQQQLPEEENNTPAELNTNHAINNTFNVSVAMSQDKQNSVLDLNQFEQALTDVLRTTARRHGLEV